MKSFALIATSWTLAAATFAAAIAPNSANSSLAFDEFKADGIMLHEVVISSLPTVTLPEIFVRPADSTNRMPEFTLPEVVITGQKMPEFTLPEVVISAKKTRV